jgi:hypothetical protein
MDSTVTAGSAASADEAEESLDRFETPMHPISNTEEITTDKRQRINHLLCLDSEILSET